MAQILAVANAILAALLAVFAFRFIRSKDKKIANWVKAIYALIGVYWCALYTWVAIVPAGIVDPVWFGQVFVRPAFTVTLAVMAGGGDLPLAVL